MIQKKGIPIDNPTSQIFANSSFLRDDLRLHFHPHKVSIRKFRQGIDFLGYIVLPNHRQVRLKTKRRMLRKLENRADAVAAGLLSEERAAQSLQSYLGVLSHVDCYRLSRICKINIGSA